MASDTTPATEQTPARRGTARFWWPFAALVVLFSGLAIAYSTSNDGDPGAPGAVKKPTAETDADTAPSHGLEPAPDH